MCKRLGGGGVTGGWKCGLGLVLGYGDAFGVESSDSLAHTDTNTLSTDTVLYSLIIGRWRRGRTLRRRAIRRPQMGHAADRERQSPPRKGWQDHSLVTLTLDKARFRGTLCKEVCFPPATRFPVSLENKDRGLSLPEKCLSAHPTPTVSRDAFEGEGPQRRSQRRLGRRLEEVAKAVGGGYYRLQMPLRQALAVRGTVAGHSLGALEGGGGYPHPF